MQQGLDQSLAVKTPEEFGRLSNGVAGQFEGDGRDVPRDFGVAFQRSGATTELLDGERAQVSSQIAVSGRCLARIIAPIPNVLIRSWVSICFSMSDTSHAKVSPRNGVSA